MYSYHNFMFPFRFDFIKKGIVDRHEYYKNHSFDDRVKIDLSFYNMLKKDNWEYSKFNIEENYNEFAYFHDFVKDSLYNINECFKEGATSWFFNKNFKKAYFEFSIKKDEDDKNKDVKTYKFKFLINSISLRIFDTGIGILSFDFDNNEYSQKEEILKINEFGRRIYPQFLDNKKSTTAVKGAFLADSICISIDNEKFEEDFNKLDLNKIKIGDHILSLLGKHTFTQNLNDKNKYLIQHIIDDRMFVVSWYNNEEIVNEWKNTQKDMLESSCHKYEENDFWYQYVFIDGKDKTVQNPTMQKDLIKKATYDRWVGNGTLFGITRYSFVCLSDDSYFSKEILRLHMKSMYFQMFTIILTLRATILRFSDEITAISDIDENDKKLEERVRNLYKNYLRFKNKIYFRELTAQDQGIELYEKALEITKIEKEINDLANEINALHTYVNIITEKETNEKMNKLTEMGAVFLPATLVVGFFGMNTFPDKLINNPTGLFLSVIIMILSIVFVAKKYKINLKDFLDM